MMFKEKHIHKVYAFALAAVFALVLAGCGGGGGGSTTPPDMPPTMPDSPASTAQEQFEARSALAEARDAVTAAVAAADAAVAAAAMSVSEAANALQNAMTSRTDVTTATAEHAKAVDAKAKADAAKTAADAAKAAVDALSDEDIGTRQGAADLKAAADAEKAKAMTAEANANAAKMAAADAAMAAADAATTQVLGLFRMANASGVEDEDDMAAEMAAAAAAVAAAATNQTGATSVGVMWPADTPATQDAAAMPGLLNIAIDLGSGALPFDAVDDEETGEGAVQTDERTAKRMDGLPGFTHGYEISDVGTDGFGSEVIVFTDKQQATPAVAEETVTLTNVPVTLGRIVRRTADTPIDPANLSGTAAYDHDGDPDTLPVAGTFATCTAEEGCISTVDGEITGSVARNGRTFSTDADGEPIVAQAPEQEDDDYLAFGIWMTKAADGADDGSAPDFTFGAFFAGGTPYTVADALEGTATYRGSAVGVKTVADSSSWYVQGTAALTADFGADDAPGTLTGLIAIGGEEVVLGRTAISGTGVTNGNAISGAIAENPDGTAGYTYTGNWSAGFFGPAVDSDNDPVMPGSVAGTFGVSGGTGDAAMSLVGAFGAHRQ